MSAPVTSPDTNSVVAMTLREVGKAISPTPDNRTYAGDEAIMRRVRFTIGAALSLRADALDRASAGVEWNAAGTAATIRVSPEVFDGLEARPASAGTEGGGWCR